MTLLPDPTPLELGLEAANDSYGRLAPKLAAIPRIGRGDTPSAWLPWVLVSKGLEDIVPYVRDMEKALREGPAWLRVRGTDPAIKIGIDWVDSTGQVAPADGRHAWYKFQVGFDTPPADTEHPRQLTGIVNLSKSSWDELFRIYSTARDFRPVRMDRHRADRGGTYDAYSGEQLWPGGPLISFGWAGTFELATDTAIEVTTQIGQVSSVAWFGNGLRYDFDRFGGRTEPVLSGTLSIEASAEIGLDAGDGWPSAYPRGSWRNPGDITIIATPLEIS